MEDSFLRTLTEIFFTFIPTGFFVQFLDGIAALLTAFFNLFGLQPNIVGF